MALPRPGLIVDVANRQMKLISKDYAKARQVAYAFQVILGILSMMVLDNGLCFGIFINSMVAYWVCYFIITLRRPDNPSNIDIIFLAWSFPVICIFIAPIVSIIGLAIYCRVFGLLN
jgi:hypothetical protein